MTSVDGSVIQLRWDEITFEEEVNGKYWPGALRGFAGCLKKMEVGERSNFREKELKFGTWETDI